jgi:uncharacterized cupin superfamily protein
MSEPEVDPPRPNVFGDEWERTMEQGRFAMRGTRVGARAGAKALGATVCEIPPGKVNLPYHAHHALEEMIVVLRGTPVLRTPEGERQLAEGEVVVCLPGRAGAHQLRNDTSAPVRVMMISDHARADVVEYPDSGRISAQGGEWGTPSAISYMLSTEHQLGYFEGEEM